MNFTLKYCCLILLLAACGHADQEGGQTKSGSISKFAPLPEWGSNHEQVVFIEADKDTLIECSNGAIVFFPANAFKPQKGKTIKLVIDAYSGVQDYLLAGLTTSSHGMPLESGGMLRILAYENNIPIDLNSGFYRVYFPKKKNSESDSMRAFLGVEKKGKVEWHMQSSASAQTGFSDTSFVVVKPIDFTIKKTYRGYRGYAEGVLKQLDSDTTLFEYLKQHYNPPAELLYRISSNDTVKFSLHINVDENNNASLSGDGYVWFENKDGSRMDIDASESLIEYNKKFAGNLPEFHCSNWISGYEVYEFSFYCPGPSYTTKMKLMNMNLNETDYYVLDFLKLGWINCDKFINASAFVTIELEAEADTKNYIIFNNRESIMNGEWNGTSIHFKNIPKGESVTIVSIKMENNNPVIFMIDLIASESKIKPDEYKSFSLHQLKEGLAKINSVSSK